MSSTGLRGHSLKLYKEQARLDVRKYFFSHRVVDTWNALPETVIGCNNVNTFKIKLDLNLNDRGYIYKQFAFFPVIWLLSVWERLVKLR